MFIACKYICPVCHCCIQLLLLQSHSFFLLSTVSSGLLIFILYRDSFGALIISISFPLIITCSIQFPSLGILPHIIVYIYIERERENLQPNCDKRLQVLLQTTTSENLLLIHHTLYILLDRMFISIKVSFKTFGLTSTLL